MKNSPETQDRKPSKSGAVGMELGEVAVIKPTVKHKGLINFSKGLGP